MKAADRRGLTCMQEKTKHHLFFSTCTSCHLLQQSRSFFPSISKARFSENFSLKSSVDMLLRVRYSYHWIFKRKIHFLSCSGKHVYSSCTDAGWFRLTCHTCCRQQQEKPLSLIIHIFNKVKKTALSKLTFSTAKS